MLNKFRFLFFKAINKVKKFIFIEIKINFLTFFLLKFKMDNKSLLDRKMTILGYEKIANLVRKRGYLVSFYKNFVFDLIKRGLFETEKKSS